MMTLAKCDPFHADDLNRRSRITRWLGCCAALLLFELGAQGQTVPPHGARGRELVEEFQRDLADPSPDVRIRAIDRIATEVDWLAETKSKYRSRRIYPPDDPERQRLEAKLRSLGPLPTLVYGPLLKACDDTDANVRFAAVHAAYPRRWDSSAGLPVFRRLLAELAKSPTLKELFLSNTAVSDKGLIALAGLKTLRTLNLSNTKVSAEGVKKLHEALPDCKINWDGNSISPGKE